MGGRSKIYCLVDMVFFILWNIFYEVDIEIRQYLLRCWCEAVETISLFHYSHGFDTSQLVQGLLHQKKHPELRGIHIYSAVPTWNWHSEPEYSITKNFSVGTINRLRLCTNSFHDFTLTPQKSLWNSPTMKSPNGRKIMENLEVNKI